MAYWRSKFKVIQQAKVTMGASSQEIACFVLVGPNIDYSSVGWQMGQVLFAAPEPALRYSYPPDTAQKAVGAKKEALAGYVLEEVLAYLIRGAGYKIITAKGLDSQLREVGAGLAVEGRGGLHQVDVLGELEWPPAFTFPIRLFVEAKFRGGETRLPTVRNAIATILDINQANQPDSGTSLPAQKYHYVYSLFSTSGFSWDAEKMAFAHQVSLVDLSGPEYYTLLASIRLASERIAAEFGRQRGIVGALRRTLRLSLETPTVGTSTDERRSNLDNQLEPLVGPAIMEARRFGELLVGVANGPYLLLLAERERGEFLRYAEEHQRHRVKINWRTDVDSGQTWIISPADRSDAYQLRFRLPDILYRWIFKTDEEARRRAMEAKMQYFQSITIFHRDADGDRLFRLNFDPLASLAHVE